TRVPRPHRAPRAPSAPPGGWQDGQFHRIDVSEAHWNESLPEGAVSWWRQQRPDLQEQRGPRLLDSDTLYGIFTDCAQSRERPRQCMAWLLAWLLIRQRYLRYHDIINEGDDAFLIFQRRGSGQPLQRIRDPLLHDEEHTLLQQQIEDLFTHGGEVIDDQHPSP
ncbi:MAG: hypothetical protein EA401_10080, partial [Planctomycetota bacterium]